MKHQIVSRWDSAKVLFECDVPDGIESGLRMRYALEKATSADANLTGAYLTRANLAGANLAEANLAEADLAGANLAEANLTRANLAGANLTRAYLAEANLTRANLAGANLTRAYLAGAYLAGARWQDITISKPPIQLFGLYWPVTILDSHMQIGCEMHSLPEWAEFDDARICEMDGRNALRFWRAHKDALLALAKSAERSFDPVVDVDDDPQPAEAES